MASGQALFTVLLESLAQQKLSSDHLSLESKGVVCDMTACTEATVGPAWVREFFVHA